LARRGPPHGARADAVPPRHAGCRVRSGRDGACRADQPHRVQGDRDRIPPRRPDGRQPRAKQRQATS
jgi:hypothetical protein